MQIVVCQCKNAGLISQTLVDEIVRVLSGCMQVVCIDDLCAMAASRDERLVQWANEPMMVMACYQRTVKAIFEHVGQSLPASTTLFNLRTAKSIDEIIKQVPDRSGAKGQIGTVKAADPGWPAWFPFIDYSRCKNCKQCLNFCLFGVYALSEDKLVRVVRPRSCKNGCPACARVCPHAAIIFPKYDKAPINGDEVDESIWRQTCLESAELLKHRLAGNILQALHDRGQPGSMKQPNLDIEALKARLDVPDSLLDSDKSL